MTWNKKKDIFALMVGHGKSLDGSWDPGCTYGSYTEAGLMLPIVKTAAKWLRKSGVRVLTDADAGNKRNMKSSVAWAERNGCKRYMSVHCDNRLNATTKSPSGIAPLYVSAAGKKMADTVGKSIAKSMGMKWLGSTRRTDLYELNATTMPSVILETGFIKADLKKLKDYKKYGKALAKAICKYLGVEIYVSRRTQLLRKMAFVIAYMNTHGFRYQVSGNAYSWKTARRKKTSNCATAASYACQLAGALDDGQIFYINGRRVVCKGKGTKAKLLKNFTVKHPNKSPRSAKAKKGYITGYSKNPHTQMYAGMNKKNKPTWYSWGPSDVGDKQPKRKPSYDNKKIETMLIIKEK